MSFWGRVFGSSEATKEMISIVRDTGDALYYTDEEKADDRLRANREAQAVMLEWIKNSQGQSLSRRLLAIAITFSWLGFKMLGVLVAIAGTWFNGAAEQFTRTQAQINNFTVDMNSLVLVIIGFYFASPSMKVISEAALKRFSENGNGRANRITNIESNEKH